MSENTVRYRVIRTYEVEVPEEQASESHAKRHARNPGAELVDESVTQLNMEDSDAGE